MPTDRELTATFVILGYAHIAADRYDAKGGFVLLDSIAAGLGDMAPVFLDAACHLHMIAVLGDSDAGLRAARLSMVSIIGDLERRLATDTASRAESQTSP